MVSYISMCVPRGSPPLWVSLWVPPIPMGSSSPMGVPVGSPPLWVSLCVSPHPYGFLHPYGCPYEFPITTGSPSLWVPPPLWVPPALWVSLWVPPIPLASSSPMGVPMGSPSLWVPPPPGCPCGFLCAPAPRCSRRSCPAAHSASRWLRPTTAAKCGRRGLASAAPVSARRGVNVGHWGSMRVMGVNAGHWESMWVTGGHCRSWGHWGSLPVVGVIGGHWG